jgi:hypothetical protein
LYRLFLYFWAYQFNRLHGGVQIILEGLIKKPHIALISSTTPIMVIAIFPAIENWFILPLIIGTLDGKGIFCPDDKSPSFTTRIAKGGLQCIQFRTAHADINSSLKDPQHIGTGFG